MAGLEVLDGEGLPRVAAAGVPARSATVSVRAAAAGLPRRARERAALCATW
ncbi:hypothetical protein [Planobispora longispora]|uniref:hypothetical protein n=1 Tax=Planobispora longispora TaxID=28887 RepID=UPI00360FA2F0